MHPEHKGGEQESHDAEEERDFFAVTDDLCRLPRGGKLGHTRRYLGGRGSIGLRGQLLPTHLELKILDFAFEILSEQVPRQILDLEGLLCLELEAVAMFL